MHAVAPKRVSFLAFVGANVLVDVEPLYFMLTDQDNLHRFFHTYIGVTLVAVATFLLFAGALKAAAHVRMPNMFRWQSMRLVPVALGAFLGAYSHIVLDSVMHADIRPFAPISQANPLYLALSLDTLHNLCLLAGVVAVVVLVLRRLVSGRDG